MIRRMAVLIPTGLMLTAGAGWAQTAPGTPAAPPAPSQLAPSRTQLALNDEVIALLVKELGGEDQLFRKVTGSARQFNQTLKITVPDAALQREPISYDGSVRLAVAGVMDYIPNCDDKKAKTNSKKKKPFPFSASWSSVRSDALGVARPISVGTSISAANGMVVSAYSFDPPSPPTINASTQEPLQLDDAMSANPHTLAAYRKQVVVLRGNQTMFQAKARVNSNVPIHFSVETQGTNTPFYIMADSPRITALSAAPGAAGTDSDTQASLGDSLLVSKDGAWMLAKEQGSDLWGSYSVLDATRSKRLPQAIVPARVWNIGNRACGESDLTITRGGDLVWTCEGQMQWQSSNYGDKGCRYLAFGDLGELICYSANVEGMDSAKAATLIVWRNNRKGSPPDPSSLRVTTTEYQRTVFELTGQPSQEITLKGMYSGDHVVSVEFSCADEPLKLPNDAAACKARGEEAPQAHKLCPQTAQFLEPFSKAHREASVIDQ